MNIKCLYDECLSIVTLKDKFHPKNRNTHSDDQIQRLAKILKYQGIRYPVKISKQTGYVTSGHGRVLAAEFNEWDRFPVNYQDYDDDIQEYADIQADNAIASWAELDLSGVNADIGDLGPFDIDYLGIKDFHVEVSEKEIEIKEKELDENISTDKECPSCGYKW